VRIEAFDPRTAPADLLSGAHDVVAQVEADDTPDESPTTLAEFVAECRHAPALVDRPHWLATSDGRPLGVASIELADVPDNRTFATIDVSVVPAARRAGVGNALLRAVLDRARSEGRDLTTAYALAGGPGGQFLEAHGFTRRQVERRSRLRTAAIDRTLLDGWIERAAERAGDYSLVGWVGACPEGHVEDFARVSMVMNTAPLDDVEFEDMAITPERIRTIHSTYADRGSEPWVLCARHERTGELAGYTDLRYSFHRTTHAHQDDTGVDPAHRGRGLGRWLKAANLLRLLDAHPEVERVSTWNAEGNTAMLSINVAMGFRPWQEWGTFQPGPAP